MHEETSQDLLFLLLVLHGFDQSSHSLDYEELDLLVLMSGCVLTGTVLLVDVDETVESCKLSLEKRPKGPLVYTYRHLIPEIILILLQI